MPVLNRIADYHADMTAWRRDLHAHPELGFEEVRTSAIVADKLRSWGIEVHTGIAHTGVVGVIRGQRDTGRGIGLRADMDALPMPEETGLPYASTHRGRMHACGHDGHTTMLLGAARYLAETRNFDGTVYVIFQPAEEGLGGAKVMIDEGLFDRFPMDQVYGMHNWPDLPAGQVGAFAGPVMAAADRIEITVHGHGGHGAMPHQTVDPIVVASHIVTALQTVVSRTVDPIDKAVVSVTKVQAGTAFNVIPEFATMAGTVRTLKPEVRDQVETAVRRTVEHTASAFGARADLVYTRGYPPTVNHDMQSALAASAAEAVVGEAAVHRDLDPCMGGEDFAYMFQSRPGCYLWIGQGKAGRTVGVHNTHYDFNDEILPIGASVWAKLVETALPRAD